jgi:nicotinamide riboside transporter PnuC
MSCLQTFIIVMGLAGQILVARQDYRGYVAWIAGNVALMYVYYQTHQLPLIGLQVVNSAIQLAALFRWLRARQVSRSVDAQGPFAASRGRLVIPSAPAP